MKNIKYCFLFIGVLTMASCAKLEQIPDGINTTENLFRDQKDVEAAINAMYTSLRSHDMYNQFSETMQSQGTDDSEWGFGRNTSNAGKLAIDKFTFSASTDVIYRHWQIQYRIINRTNIAIENVQAMSDIDPEKRKQYIGEAYFLRGLMFFNLARLFGEIPLPITATTDLDNVDRPKEPIDKVYEQIINDFKAAKENLPLTYGSVDIGRATKGAAMALLTKAYLTNKQFQEAADEAKAVIDLGVYSLWSNYADIFKIENENKRESIFEVQFINMGAATGSYGSSFAGFFKPSALVLPPAAGSFGGYGDNPVTRNHYDIYGDGDLRKDVNVIYIPTAPSSIRDPLYVNKYQDPNAMDVEDGANNYIIIRYADVLLMYAEALHEVNTGSIEAYEAFNKVRRRAYGLPIDLPSQHDLVQGLSTEEFRDSILLERRKELAFEGHRRFDLLRMGKLKEAMNIQDPTILVENKHVFLPIPQDELIVNKALTPTDGY